jgi:uncharacterized phage protein (predicted DNA packaging)
MNLEEIKKHIRVDHSFEDDLLESYTEWAETEIKDSVSTSDSRNDEYFEGNPHYERAVVLLTGHYFENRLPMVETELKNLPFGIVSAVHKLRGGYYEIE